MNNSVIVFYVIDENIIIPNFSSDCTEEKLPDYSTWLKQYRSDTDQDNPIDVA